MDGGAWQAVVHGVAKSQTRLSDFTFTFMHWRRKWQPTPVFLPGESQGQRSLLGCRLWGCTELDTTEATQQQQQQNVNTMRTESSFYSSILSQCSEQCLVHSRPSINICRTAHYIIIAYLYILYICLLKWIVSFLQAGTLSHKLCISGTSNVSALTHTVDTDLK